MRLADALVVGFVLWGLLALVAGLPPLGMGLVAAAVAVFFLTRER